LRNKEVKGSSGEDKDNERGEWKKWKNKEGWSSLTTNYSLLCD
jgi:hypothetical protein